MNGKAILNCIYSAVLGGVVTFFVMDKLAESRESKNDAYWLDEYNKREAEFKEGVDLEVQRQVEKIRKELKAYYEMTLEYELGERPPNDPKDIVMADEIEKEVEEMEEYEEETTFEEDADGIMHGSDGSYVGPLMQNRRDAKAPYVINIDEFTNEKSEYDKVTLTYFDGDDVLIDTDDDSEIDDVEEIIGRSWKGAFGIGSDDEDIVYVRNEGLAIDYEVVRTWNRYLGGLDIHDLAEKVAPIPKRKRFDDAEEE